MNIFNCLDSSEKNSRDNVSYGNNFLAMVDGVDDEDSIEEFNCSIGKKKRLRIDQVQALERIFEVDNKLDPERKIKLAQELGLQPRQVAIWFQNRRARWKTKQLERDYQLLKANYEALQLNYSKIEQEKEGLVAELRGLKEKLGENATQTDHTIEKVANLLSPQNMVSEKCNDSGEFFPIHENHDKVYRTMHLSSSETKRITDFKEGLSDSDSSGVLNEDSNNLNVQPLVSILNSCPKFNGLDLDQSVFSLSAPVYHPHLLDSRDAAMVKDYQQQFVKIQEQNHFTADHDSSNFFSVDQAPLFWYFSDHRNH
ncbi:hypothetical protein ACH5RR_026932 [Cinchona calisaya]|uniref:Homeobox-leucine zipper protein n=1 Tax=Cinchona calisaya TaxID=153742 RepID=A0ABD2Z7C1_9GENT